MGTRSNGVVSGPSMRVEHVIYCELLRRGPLEPEKLAAYLPRGLYTGDLASLRSVFEAMLKEKSIALMEEHHAHWYKNLYRAVVPG